jgi:hypothetical protein
MPGTSSWRNNDFIHIEGQACYTPPMDTHESQPTLKEQDEKTRNLHDTELAYGTVVSPLQAPPFCTIEQGVRPRRGEKQKKGHWFKRG